MLEVKQVPPPSPVILPIVETTTPPLLVIEELPEEEERTQNESEPVAEGEKTEILPPTPPSAEGEGGQKNNYAPCCFAAVKVVELEEELALVRAAKEHNDALAMEHEADLLETQKELEAEIDRLLPPSWLVSAVDKVFGADSDDESDMSFYQKVSEIVKAFPKLEVRLERAERMNNVLLKQIGDMEKHLYSM